MTSARKAESQDNMSHESQRWDHSSHDKFYEYYAQESASDEAQGRVCRVRDHILRLMRIEGRPTSALDVADLGCGAGAQSVAWAEKGHRVHAIDVNEPLVDLGRKRAAEGGFRIDFRIGSATKLPWPDHSMDVCIALELLEHVTDWEACLSEAIRVLRPGGGLFITTTNRLCPIQAEFNLPLYSWYPGPLKRHYEKLSLTTRPDLANYARYPAVHWFTFSGLAKLMAQRGFRSFDRFDIMDTEHKGSLTRLVVSAVRAVPAFRYLGQVCTPGTIVLALKDTR